jgi:hypothetical protein
MADGKVGQGLLGAVWTCPWSWTMSSLNTAAMTMTTRCVCVCVCVVVVCMFVCVSGHIYVCVSYPIGGQYHIHTITYVHTSCFVLLLLRPSPPCSAR